MCSKGSTPSCKEGGEKGGECRATAYVLGLISIFKEFAGKDADKDHLNKSELKDLLTSQFPGLINESKPEEVNEILKSLDFDKDGQVDINEYMIMLCSLGVIMYEYVKGGQCAKKK